MRILQAAFAAVLALGLAAAPSSAATFYLTTGVGTHETTIDADTPASWTFFADPPHISFDGGVFAMKHGPTTTFGIKMELIDFDTSDVLVRISYADVNSYLAAGGSSEFEKFIFLYNSVGYHLSSYFRYTVSLSLVDNGTGNAAQQSYVLRGLPGGAAERVVTNDAESIIVTQATNTAVETPEPASALVLGAGLLALGLNRRRRNQAAT